MSVLRNALADLDHEDGDELPLAGQATPPLQLEDPLEPLEELGKVGSQLRPSSPAGNFSLGQTLGGQSNLVIDEVRKVLDSKAVWVLRILAEVISKLRCSKAFQVRTGP